MILHIKNLLDFFINLCGDCIAVVELGLIITTEEDLFACAEIHIANLITHTPLGHHLARELRCALNIVGCTCGDVLNDKLFRRTTCKQHCDIVKELASCHVVVIVVRERDCIACRLSARNNADFVHAVAVLHKFGNDCVSTLMICGDALVGLRDDTALLCRTCHNLVDGFADILHVDERSILSCRKDCRFVQKVFNICARKARCQTCKTLEVDFVRERFVARVHLEDLLSALDVRDVDKDLTVKSARSHKCRVKDVNTVGCRHNDD